jgi:transcriptional regulator with XRE-family HTH domain
MAHPVISQLGVSIRKLRTMKGISREVLSELAGVHYNTLKQIEAGRANPTMRALLGIAEALDTSLDQLLTMRK